jgi:ribosome-associated protein
VAGKPASKAKVAGKPAAKKAAPRKAAAARNAPARKPTKAPAVGRVVKPARPSAPRKAAKPAQPVQPTLLTHVLAQLEDAKAEAISTISLEGKGAIADSMVVASGRSSRHVGAIADQLLVKLRDLGYRNLRVEGMPQCDWVLVDAGDVLVHIFRPEVRSFYNLEKLWSASAPQDHRPM